MTIFLVLAIALFIQGCGEVEPTGQVISEPEEPVEEMDYRLKAAYTSCMIYCGDTDPRLCDKEVEKEAPLDYITCSLNSIGSYCYCVLETDKGQIQCKEELDNIYEKFCNKKL